MGKNSYHGIGQREFSSLVHHTQIGERRLWRDKGLAVVACIDGVKRYIYDDKTPDYRSVVDERVEHFTAVQTETGLELDSSTRVSAIGKTGLSGELTHINQDLEEAA